MRAKQKVKSLSGTKRIVLKNHQSFLPIACEVIKQYSSLSFNKTREANDTINVRNDN